MNFCVVINSPLSGKFAINPSSGFPPFHVQLLNQSSTKNKEAHINTHEKLVKQIKHIENALNHDSESTTSSKSSNTAITILSNFSEKNTVPIYRHIIIGFIFVITCCLIVSMVGFLVFTLDWDGTDPNSTNNPLNDTINYLRLQHLTASVMINLWDIQEYKSNSNLNITEIANYFNALTTYDASMDAYFASKFTQFKTFLYKCLRNPSSTLQAQFLSRFNTMIQMKNNMSVWSNSVVIPEQNITFQSLMVNYLDDINLMSKGIYDDRLLLPISYSYDVIGYQNGTTLAPIIDSSINSSLQISLILAICMNILIALLLIPMFFFLRSRLPIH